MKDITLFWHRRDLRLRDNRGLFNALESSGSVLPLFIFDTNILDKLEDKEDPRVTFIFREIEAMRTELREIGADLLVKYGTPAQVFKDILSEYNIAAVYTNRDYEPYAKDRDKTISDLLAANGIPFYTFKDQVIFEFDEVLKKDGTPYTVFTPYSKRWREKLKEQPITTYPCEQLSANFLKTAPLPELSLEDMGFRRSDLSFPEKVVPQGIIKNYDQTRNFPAVRGTSKLGVHFRFGTISIREKAAKAIQLNDVFLNELIWRDFYSMILGNFPQVVDRAFKPAYDQIPWRDAPDEFECWCQGKTGYPIVDAGMRELNATGYMHNRVRMITASFLTKHLLLDWRLGEAYFAAKLLDYDLASNCGGWQWAMGGGTDAAPYFRIFNPISQQEKFDLQFTYVKRWVPEYGTTKYPKPMVEHKFARERCLQVYKDTLNREP